MAEKKEAAKESGKPEESKEKLQSKKTEKTEEVQAEDKKEDSYLKDLMAISGHGGLFKFISQGRNGIIVEHLETGKRMQAFATMKVSALEDIAVYTEDEEIQLAEVFEAIHKYEKGKEAISHKSDNDELKEYFGAVVPEYDRERVYVSDIKKVLGWYNTLLKYDLLEIGKLPKKSADKIESKDTETKAVDKTSGKKDEAKPEEKKSPDSKKSAE